MAGAEFPAGGASSSPVRCEVWLAGLASYRSAQQSLLDEVEFDRLRRYPMDADRSRFTVAAALGQKL